MKKPEEIKKDIIDCMEEAIEIGKTCDVQGILDFSDKVYVCMATTRAYIQQLEAELATVKRERGAAVRDLNLTTPCDVCMNNKGCPGWPRHNPCQWQWRGVCPQNTEVQTNE